MKKISEYRDEEALDLLADIMEPAVAILADPDVRLAFEHEHIIKAVRVAIKGHKRSVMEILARMEGVPVEEYHCNVITLPARLLEVLNDKEVLGFFTEQAQNANLNAVSGPATEITEETEKK